LRLHNIAFKVPLSGFNEVINEKEGVSPIICQFGSDQGLISQFFPRILRNHDPMESKVGNEDTNPPTTTLVACRYSYFNISLFFMMTKHGGRDTATLR